MAAGRSGIPVLHVSSTHASSTCPCYCSRCSALTPACRAPNVGMDSGSTGLAAYEHLLYKGALSQRALRSSLSVRC